MAVVGVDVRVQGARVDDERYRPTSRARISSMRSETSSRPLAPAPAALSLRRPPTPRYASSASLVSSETVFFLRSASCRSRASSSSLILTVVRFKICQHTSCSGERSYQFPPGAGGSDTFDGS
jgi:hypothetical protein